MSVASVASVASGGHVAPGDSVGTLTIGGNAIFAQGSELDFEFSAPDTDFQIAGTGDSVNVGGNLELDGAVLNIRDVGGIYGVPVAQNAAVVNMGANWRLAPNVKLDASYNGRWASRAKDQAVRLSLDVSF